jgi:DNA processing protein
MEPEAGDASILNSPSLAIVGTRRPTVDTERRWRREWEGTWRNADCDDRERIGARGRRDCASGHDGSWRTGDWSVRHGNRCLLPEGKQETVRESAGAIISEFPTGFHRAPENFPVRNRIIAGMPLGVVIVEGKPYSGSLITARLAMEFGREVFGVPGNVTPEVSFAPKQLIKQGAKLVTNAEDVIEELPAPVGAALAQAEAAGAEQRNLLPEDGLTPTETNIYGLLSAEGPKPIEELVETTGLNSSEVLATLFSLEIKGIIRQLPGKQFCKVLL